MIYYPQSNRRSYRSFIVILIILLIVAGVGFFVYRVVSPETVAMQPHPIVAVESCSTVHIVGTTTSNDVLIQATVGGNYPKYEREIEGNTLYIKGQRCFTIDLRVPAQTDLRLIASSSIDVSGVTGEMQLKGGAISLFKSTLQGKSTLDSGSEPIFFSGTIDRQTTLTITTISSLVDIELPKLISFNLDLTGSLISFNTTFPGIPLNVDSSSRIAEVHTLVGSSTQARLSIKAIDAPVLLTGV